MGKPYDPTRCMFCGAKNPRELERHDGTARCICAGCGGMQQVVLYHGRPTGRIEGWNGFGPLRGREEDGVREKRERWRCAEHDFAAKTGQQWGAHVRRFHPKPSALRDERVRGGSIEEAIEILENDRKGFLEGLEKVDRSLEVLRKIRDAGK